jgi:hypothetical protein
MPTKDPRRRDGKQKTSNRVVVIRDGKLLSKVGLTGMTVASMVCDGGRALENLSTTTMT